MMTSPFDMVCMLYTSKENVDIPNTYPLHKVYMGLIIKGPPSQKYHHFPYEYEFWQVNLDIRSIMG